MATALPIVQLPTGYSTVPTDVVYTACDQPGGNTFLSTGKEMVLAKNTGSGTDDVQTLSAAGPPTAGTFTLALTLYGIVYTTAAIVYTATATVVRDALRAATGPNGEVLTANQKLGITASGGALPTTPVVITFTGGALGGQLVSAIVPNSGALTGGTVSIAHTTPGTGDHTFTISSVADVPFGRTKDEGPILVGGGNIKATQIIPSLGWANQGLVTISSSHAAMSYCVLRLPATD